jgi:hypothetical protein
MWALVIVILIIIIIVMPVGNTCIANSAYEMMRSKKEKYMPYAQRVLFEAGPERESSGLNGPMYSWGRQAVNIPYGPLIMPYPDTAHVTDAKIRSINDAELSQSL